MTKLAWYKLQEPSESYKEIFKPTALRYEVCSTAVDAVQEDPDMDISEAIDGAIAAYVGTGGLDVKIRSFLTPQLEAWMQVC